MKAFELNKEAWGQLGLHIQDTIAVLLTQLSDTSKDNESLRANLENFRR